MDEFYKGMKIIEDDEFPYDLNENQYIYRSQFNRLKQVIIDKPLEFNTLNYLECNYETYINKGYRYA